MRRFLPAAAVLGFLVVSCGSGAGGVGATGATGGAHTTSTTTVGTGGAGGTAGTGGSGGGASSSSGGFPASFSHQRYGGLNVDIDSLSATFFEWTTPPFSQCTAPAYSGCYVTTCTSPGMSATGGDRSAGDITLAVDGVTVLTAKPGAMNKYPTATATPPLFHGGETLSIAAAGSPGGVPAFTASDIAPTTVDFESPPMPSPGQSFSLDRTQDLAFTWGGTGAKGHVAISLISDGGPSSPRIACYFPAAAGQGTIPKEALASLPLGSTGSFDLGGGRVQYLDVPGWAITYRTFIQATWQGQELNIFVNFTVAK